MPRSRCARPPSARDSPRPTTSARKVAIHASQGLVGRRGRRPVIDVAATSPGVCRARDADRGRRAGRDPGERRRRADPRATVRARAASAARDSPGYRLEGLERLGLAPRGPMTPLVGRDAELEQLRRALARAAAGHGQVVAIVGEPGVGKSRLVWEVTQAHRGQGWLVLHGDSRLLRQATPYLPVIELLKRLLPDRGPRRPAHDPREGDGASSSRSTGRWSRACPRSSPCSTCPWTTARGKRWIRRSGASGRSRRSSGSCCGRARASPLLAGVRGPALDRRRDAGAARQPGREPADRAAAAPGRTTARSTSTAGAARPTTRSSAWTRCRRRARDAAPRGAARRRSELQRLKATADRADRGQSVLPGGERADAGGDRRARGRAGRVSAGSGRSTRRRCRRRCRRSWPRASTGSPPEDKRLLQAASVIGKDVPVRAAPGDRGAAARTPLRRGLARLQAAEFLYETRLFPDLEYTFKHALTHEVAYGSLLQDRRRALHARIVEAIERALPRAPGRAGRAAGPPRLPGRGVGEGGQPISVRPAPRRGALGLPRGGGVLRAGARRRSSTCRRAATTREQAIDLRLDLRGALARWASFERVLDAAARGRGPRRGAGRRAPAGLGLGRTRQTRPRLAGDPDRALELASGLCHRQRAW